MKFDTYTQKIVLYHHKKYESGVKISHYCVSLFEINVRLQLNIEDKADILQKVI